MNVTAQDIQKLYIAYFTRPADHYGLQFHLDAANTVGLPLVADGFIRSPEFQQAYSGKTDAQFIGTLYQNLFGRTADMPGMNFWMDLLERGVVTHESIAMELLKGAINEDKTTVTNKIAASEAFHAALTTPDRIAAYTGTNANALSKAWLAGVTTNESLVAATAPAALDALLSAISMSTNSDDVSLLNQAPSKGGTADSWFTVGESTFVLQEHGAYGSSAAGTDGIARLIGVMDLSASPAGNGTDVLTIA